MTPEELVRKYGDLVFSLALRLTRNRAEAEDLAQDCLIKAVKGLPNFRGDSDPRTWLYRIVANAWKNQLRWNSVRKALRFFGEDGTVESEPEIAGADPSAEDSAAAAESRAAVDAAIAALPPEEGAVLTLRELDGLSYGEISEILDIPLGTVKSRLARARGLIAAALGKEEPDARDR